MLGPTQAPHTVIVDDNSFYIKEVISIARKIINYMELDDNISLLQPLSSFYKMITFLLTTFFDAFTSVHTLKNLLCYTWSLIKPDSLFS